MIKTLTPYRGGAALVIDRAVMDLLGINMKTPLEIVTDGESLIISPVRDTACDERVAEALETVNSRHGKTLRKLAE